VLLRGMVYLQGKSCVIHTWALQGFVRWGTIQINVLFTLLIVPWSTTVTPARAVSSQATMMWCTLAFSLPITWSHQLLYPLLRILLLLLLYAIFFGIYEIKEFKHNCSIFYYILTIYKKGQFDSLGYQPVLPPKFLGQETFGEVFLPIGRQNV